MQLSIFRTLDGYKILGYPIRIENKKYMRNAFLFNVCLVFNEEAHTVRFEPLLKKLSEYLVSNFGYFAYLNYAIKLNCNYCKRLITNVRVKKRAMIYYKTN